MAIKFANKKIAEREAKRKRNNAQLIKLIRRDRGRGSGDIYDHLHLHWFFIFLLFSNRESRAAWQPGSPAAQQLSCPHPWSMIQKCHALCKLI